MAELALKNNDVNKIKEFIKTGGNIYKELEKETYFWVRENLLTKACKACKTEIVEVLLAVYERDYKIAEKFVSNNKDKEFLLKYIFTAWNEDEIQEVLLLSEKTQKNSKKLIVFLADRQECVLVSLLEEPHLMYKLYKNGLITINCRELNGANPGHLVARMNRLDLLKRMVAIGLYTRNMHGDLDDQHNLIETVIQQSECIGLVKYCLFELQLDHEDLLTFTTYNNSIEVFEVVLGYLSNKHGSSNKKEYLQKYWADNFGVLENECTNDSITDSANYKLLAHIFTEYGLSMKQNKMFFTMFFQEDESVEYIEKILEIEKENYDDLLDSVYEHTNRFVIDEIWRTLDKTSLKILNKNNVKIIIFAYKSTQKCYQTEAREYFKMIDPLAIYDEENGNTALFIALELNCAALIRYLISKGADLLHRNKNSQTTLTTACRSCSLDTVQFVLKSCPTLINEVGSNGYYPLTELMYRDETFLDVFKEMVNYGADFQVKDLVGYTLLHHAVLSQNLKLVKLCLHLGVDPSTKCSDDNTALHLSAVGSLQIFDLILDTGNVDIEAKNYRGFTILHCVTNSSGPELFNSFLEKSKPNLNALDNCGQTALYYSYDSERYKKLVELGADTSIVGENNSPFYTLAAHYWKTDILLEIVSNPNIDLTIISDYGQGLLECLPEQIKFENFVVNDNFKELLRKQTNSKTLSCAAKIGNLPLIKLMFEYGQPQLEERTDEGEPVISQMLKYDFQKEVLEFLIAKGADIHAQNAEGNSIIFGSVFAEGTEFLLKAGVSTAVLNNKGESALHHAAQRNDLETCLLLLSYGADINLKDEDNQKPSDLCNYKLMKDFLLFIADEEY